MLHTVSLIAKRQAEKLRIPIFIVFGLTQPTIKPEFTVSVAAALSTRTLDRFICKLGEATFPKILGQ